MVMGSSPWKCTDKMFWIKGIEKNTLLNIIKKRKVVFLIQVKVNLMGQHWEIKMECKQNATTHTRALRDWGGRWFINDSGKNTGPDPCPKRADDTQTRELELSESTHRLSR